MIAAATPARSRWKWVPVALLFLSVLALFWTSPRSGDFWVNDAPRHAMDGLFYRDFFADLPLHHPQQYAINYYLRTPALTILFYPPLFAVVEAFFYAVFGISASTAQLTVAAFTLAAALGAYKLLRLWWEPVYALAACLLFFGAPEVALWARQVMLELPCLAFLFWSSYFFCRYARENKPAQLYIAAALFCAGLYTKQTVIFMAPVFVFFLYAACGRKLWKYRRIWYTASAVAAALLPLALVTWKFGRTNVDSVAGGQWAHSGITSLDSWTYYLRLLPEQLTWPTVVLAAIAMVLFALRRLPGFGRSALVFHTAWMVSGFLFFSLIALKEPRHTVVVLFPICVFAVATLRMLPRKLEFCALILPVAVFAHTVWSCQVPYIRGYGDAVRYVAANAPQNSVILFSGYRDGNFIYDLAMRRDRRDLAVLRADKLLLKVSVKRELGVEERHFTDAQIVDMLNAYGVTYIVSQPNFWDDLAPMQQLQQLLHTAQFRKIGVYRLASNFPQQDKELEIYENLGPVQHDKVALSLDLPIIGVSVSGKLGSGTTIEGNR